METYRLPDMQGAGDKVLEGKMIKEADVLLINKKGNEEAINNLIFTGNWFIDIGILGFVNLMEEVYGWNLEELDKKIEENEELVYYGYFPFAYLFYHSRIRSTDKDIKKKIDDRIIKQRSKIKDSNKKLKLAQDANKREKEIKKINKLKRELNELIKEKNQKLGELNKEKENFSESISHTIPTILKDKVNEFDNVKGNIEQIIPNFKLNKPADHVNFFLYQNPQKELVTSFKYLNYLIQKDYNNIKEIRSNISKTKKLKENIEIRYEEFPDSTVNPFLFSTKKFPNLSYTSPLSVDIIEKSIEGNVPLFICLLSFGRAFQYINQELRVFYSNNIEFSYQVNKKINRMIEQLGEKKQSLLRVTFSSIIDTIVEQKSKFSLENMYIISYTEISNQKLQDVEFIGISKFHAAILIDDTIRENINVSVPYRKEKERQYSKVWLIEELIKNKPLFPIVVGNLWLRLTEKTYLNRYACLYSVAIHTINRQKGKNIFSNNFFERPADVVVEVKDTFQKMIVMSKQMDKMGLSKEEKQNLALQLLIAIRKNQRNEFLYVLNKELAQNIQGNNLNKIGNNLFNHILSKGGSWDCYATAIVIGLL